MQSAATPAPRTTPGALQALRNVLLAGLAGLSVSLGLALSLPAPTADIGDLLSFRASGQALLMGADPYQATPGLPNLNPPFATLLFTPLALVEPDALRWGWYLLALGLLLLAFVVPVGAYRTNRPWRRLA